MVFTRIKAGSLTTGIFLTAAFTGFFGFASFLGALAFFGAAAFLLQQFF